MVGPVLSEHPISMRVKRNIAPIVRDEAARHTFLDIPCIIVATAAYTIPSPAVCDPASREVCQEAPGPNNMHLGKEGNSKGTSYSTSSEGIGRQSVS